MLSPENEALLTEAMNPKCTPDRLSEIRQALQGDMRNLLVTLKLRKASYDDAWSLERDDTKQIQAGVDGYQAHRLLQYFDGHDLPLPALTFAELQAQGEGRSLLV